MKLNQQTGIITATLKAGESITVVFEWISDSIGANLGYSWQFKEEEKSQDDVIKTLLQGECDMIGSFIKV